MLWVLFHYCFCIIQYNNNNNKKKVYWTYVKGIRRTGGNRLRKRDLGGQRKRQTVVKSKRGERKN